MNGKALVRIAAIALAAVALSAAAIEASRPPARPAPPGPPERAAARRADDDLSAALARCQALGAAAADDPLCLDAWAESRRRFLAPDRDEAPAPRDPPIDGRNAETPPPSSAPDTER